MTHSAHALSFSRIRALLTAMVVVFGIWPRAADACKSDGVPCKTRHSCCSGVCTANVCGSPTTTTNTTTTTTTTTTSTSTTTTTLHFVDNGDSTVTDHQTGLIWEKKVNSVCLSNPDVVCRFDGDCPHLDCAPCLHCVNDTYTWGSNGSVPNGTAFTSFLDTLNGGATGVGNCVSADGSTITGGFNGHCDWRLPTVVELETIVDLSAPGCGSGSPCIDPIFGPTGVLYWSSTFDSFAMPHVYAWDVNFMDGNAEPNGNGAEIMVRAVRGGS